MKTINFKSSVLALAFAGIFATAVTTSVNANDEIKHPVELKYVGNLNELPVYQLAMHNDAKATFLVSIKDEDGTVLHNERISGTNLVRNYQFDDGIADEHNLTFEVSNLDKNTTSVYSINKTKKVIDEVVVNKIK